MSWKQKRRDPVGCFGQIENIKRQSLVYTNYRLLPNKANHCSMNYQDKDLQSYIKYWNHDFQKILIWYYLEWLSDNNSCIHNMILSGDKHRSFSEIRRQQFPVDDGPQISPDEYFFSASMYYIAAIPQVICNIASPKAARAFLNSSGWPAISLGMGGFMSPEQVLYESDLIPFPNEVNRYISLLKIIHPFHRSELKDYMSGNACNLSPDEYALFYSEVKSHEESIIAELDVRISSFIDICEGIRDKKVDICDYWKQFGRLPWDMMYMINRSGYWD